ncbi:hypothetical protein N6H05_23815 [Sphingobium sp. WTD-1]|uniref:hypothetical protein n=1 Tax=Sphingobium sp. WTD-1 TaxID=2979467 RepID=UPI0024DE4601|nr:hypothetical protein [Sphingobium sp. WTD-1]WIA56007.1 hypothetical protein N6H05_23815 [Sphingobium sp. WTD-1]
MGLKGGLCLSMIALCIPTVGWTQYTPWTGSDMSLGKGYDRFLNGAKGRCVSFDRQGPINVAGENLRFELRSVENEQSLFSKLGVSVSAKYGAVKGNASYDKETSVNSYSVYFYISGDIETQKESITQPDRTAPVLLDNPRLLLERGLTDKFREKCGDTFISGMSYGGRYTALVEIKTKKDSEISSIAAAVSAAAGSFGGSANVKSRLEAATQNRDVSIKVLRQAGDGAIIPKTIPELTDAVTKFPDALQGMSKRDLQPFDVTIEEYTTIDTPENVRRSDFTNIDQEEYIINADRFVVKHRTAMANADYAIRNPDQFPQIDKGALTEYVETAEPIVLRVVSDIRKCLDGITKCKDFTAPQLAVVSPPARLEGPSRAELEGNIAKSRSALSRILLPQGQERRNWCDAATWRAGGDYTQRVGVCWTVIEEIIKQCNQTGCTP